MRSDRTKTLDVYSDKQPIQRQLYGTDAIYTRPRPGHTAAAGSSLLPASAQSTIELNERHALVEVPRQSNWFRWSTPAGNSLHHVDTGDSTTDRYPVLPKSIGPVLRETR